MASADYRLCDVCTGKAFYDANLNYEEGASDHYKPYRTAGKDQYEKPDLVEKYGTRLDYVGDWAVICNDCAKQFKTQIIPIGD